MKIRVSWNSKSQRKSELKGCCVTYRYEIVDTREKAIELKKQKQQEGYYVIIEEIEENE